MTEFDMRENYTLPRLYLADDLSSGASVDLPREQAHYLTRVIRKGEGDALRVFNGSNGEWRAVINAVGKKTAQISVQTQLRPPQPVPDVTLLFAPVRKHRTAFIIEKGTELGVRTFRPVLTARTQFPKLNVEKARAQVIEAAEQTERLDIPEVKDATPLDDVLGDWGEAPILFADEAGEAQAAKEACAKLSAPLGLLIGPDTLGPRILRADTAAVALLSVWQSVSGDW